MYGFRLTQRQKTLVLLGLTVFNPYHSKVLSPTKNVETFHETSLQRLQIKFVIFACAVIKEPKRYRESDYQEFWQ